MRYSFVVHLSLNYCMSTITQRELSNHTGKVLDELPTSGRAFVTRHGKPVAVILPIDAEVLYDYVLANVPDYLQAMTEVDSKLAAGEELEGMSADELEAELGLDS